MANEFKYVINTELKFDMSSVNSLIAQAKQTDSEIRRVFEQSAPINVKLGVDGEHLASAIRTQVNSAVTSFNSANNGLHNIKIGVHLDEQSLNTLRTQIATIREQFETIHRTQGAKPKLDVKAQLEKGDLEKIQRLVGNTKATLRVGLKLDPNDVKKVEKMVDSIKGTATANVVTRDRDGMRQVGGRLSPRQVVQRPRTQRDERLPQYDVTPARIGGDNISPTNLARWSRSGAGSIMSRYHSIKQAQETVAIHNHLQQLANKQVENIGNQLARVGKEADRQRDLELRKQQLLTQKQYESYQKELDSVIKKIAKGQQKVKVDGKFVPIQQRRKDLMLTMNAHNQAQKLLQQKDNEMFDALKRGSSEDARYYESMKKMMDREYVDPYRQAVAEAQIAKVNHQQRQREQANVRKVLGRQTQQRQTSSYDKGWDKLLTSRNRDDQRYYERMSQTPQSSYHTSNPSRDAMAQAEISRRANEQRQREEANTRRVLEQQAKDRIARAKSESENKYWQNLSGSNKKDDQSYYNYLRNSQTSGFHSPVDPVRQAMAQAEITRREHEQKQREEANARRVLGQQSGQRVSQQKSQQEQAYWEKLANSRNKDDRGYYNYLRNSQSSGYNTVDPVRSAMAQAQVTRIENEQRQREEENARKQLERQAGRRVGERLAEQQRQQQQEQHRFKSLANQPSLHDQLQDKHISLVRRESDYTNRLKNLETQANSADFNRNADEKAKRIAVKQLAKYRQILDQVKQDKERILSLLQAEVNRLNTRGYSQGLNRLPVMHTIQDEMANIQRGIRNAEEKAVQQSLAQSEKYQNGWDKLGNARPTRNGDGAYEYYQKMQQMSQRPVNYSPVDPHRQAMADAMINRIDYGNQQSASQNQRSVLLNQAGSRLRQQGADDQLARMRDRELVLKDPDVSLREKGRIVREELIPHYQQLARELGIEIPKSFEMFQRNANGVIKPVRTMTYEFDRWGQVTQKSHKSFTDMLQGIGGNLFIYGAITAGFFAITNAIKLSVQTMAEFENQMLRVDNMSKNFSDFGKGEFEGTYQSTNSTMAKYTHDKVSTDTFDIATQYGFDVNSTVMPLYQRIMKRQDLSGSPAQTKDIEKQILNFALASYGPNVDDQQISKVASDVLATYTNNIDPKLSKGQNIDKMGKFIDYMARIEQMTGYSEKAIDVVGELSVDAKNKGIDPKYVGALAGAYTLVQEDDEPAMISRTTKTLMNSLTADNDHSKRALELLDINPNKPLVTDKNGKVVSGGRMSGEEIFRAVAQKLQTEDIDPTLLNTISKELATTDASGGASKEMTPRIANMLKAMSKDEFQQMTNPMGEIWNTKGDAQNMAERNMKTLSSELRQAVQNLKEFSVLLGDLGALDGLKAVLGGFNMLAEGINSVLRAINSFDTAIDNVAQSLGFSGGPHVGSALVQTATAFAMFKGAKGLFNTFAPQNIQGPVRQWWGNMTGSGVETRRPNHFTVAGRGRGMGGAGYVVSDIASNTILGSILNRNESRNRGLNVPVGADGRRRLTVAPRTVPLGTVVDDMGNVTQAQPRRLSVNRQVLNRTLQQTGRQTLGSGTRNAVASGVGSAVGELVGFMVGGFRNRAVAGAGTSQATTSVVSRVLASMGRLGTGFVRILPILGRLTIVGTILATVIWGAIEAFKWFNKKAAEESRNNSMKYGNAISTKEGRDRIQDNLKIFNKLGTVNQLTLSGKERKQLDKAREQLEKDGIKTKVKTNGVPTKAGMVGAEDATYTYFQGTVDKDGNQTSKEKTVKANSKNLKETEKTIQNMGQIIDAYGKNGWDNAIESVDGYTERVREANKQIEQMSKLMTKLNIENAKLGIQFIGAEDSSSYMAGQIKNIQDYMSETSGLMKGVQDTKSFLEKGSQRVNDSVGDKKSVIDAVMKQSDMKKEEKKSTVKVGDLENRFNEAYEAGTIDDLKQELTGKGDLNKYKLDYVRSLEEARKLEDRYKEVEDAEAQLTQQHLEQEMALKKLRIEYGVASTGIHVYEAQLQKVSSVVGTAQSVLNMAGTDEEKMRSGLVLMKEQVKQLALQKSMLANNQQAMARIKANSGGEDFSTSGLYNPGPNGLSESQAEYKQLLEASYGMMDNVNATTESLYQQKEAIKELVLNSDKYADMWERVQSRISLVKELNKEVSDIKVDASLVDQFSSMRGMVTGQNQTQWRQSQLEGIRDRGMDVYMKAITAMKTYGADQGKLEEAFAEISKTTGDEFNDSFIQPLKDIVSQDLMGAGTKIYDGATKLESVVNDFEGVLNNFGNQFNNSLNAMSMNFQNAITTGANANQLPNYTPIQNDTGSKADVKSMTYEELMDAYIQQNFGYSKGSKGYMTTKKQMEMSYDRKDLITEMQNSVVPKVANNAVVKTYNTNIDGKLGGKLSGYGQYFVQAGAKYGVDPNLLAAIAMHETGNGSSKMVQQANNVGGITKGSWTGATYTASTGAKFRAYDSLQDGINDLGRLISVYMGQGLNTIGKIGNKWAPSGAANDPNGLNNNWASGVSKYYSQLTGTSVISGGGGSGGGGGSRSTIKVGSRGEDVKALQKALGISADGIFGNQTKSAVMAYQKKNGLSVDGIVGSQTWGKLGLSGGATSTAPSGNGKGGANWQSMNSWFESVKGDRSKMTYSWGGAHIIEDWTDFIKKGIADCSGLVEQVYRKFAGINLGTTSSAGLWADNKGTKVKDKKDLQVGDLLFFGSSASKIHHVGIYAGNGEMWTINHKGTPVSKDKVSSWGDYYGAEHYDNAFTGGGATNSTTTEHKATFKELLAQALDGLYTGLEAQVALTKVAPLKEQFKDTTDLQLGLGKLSSPLGTSGRINYFDTVNATREDVYTKQFQNARSLEDLNTTRKDYVDMANSALKSGNTEQYNAYKDAIKDLDDFGKQLRANSKDLAEWQKTLDAIANNDPRINSSQATSLIRGGYDKVRSVQAQVGSPEYVKAIEEVNTMNGSYMTKRKLAEEAGQMWNDSGVGTRGYNFVKRDSASEDLSIMYQKIKEINGVLGQFAQGSQDWFVTLEDAVAVQQQLSDLEQQRLNNAQSMFELTGTGLQGYVKQKAYTQSKDYSQDSKNLDSAIKQYESGKITKGYGIQTGYWANTEAGKASATKAKEALKNDYNIDATMYQDKDKKWRLKTDETLTKARAEEVTKRLKERKLLSVANVTGGGETKMDANQELATLQIIAGLQDQLTTQMNDYRTAVVGAFKAGAMSLEEYLAKMNDLRDVQVEAQENAIKMADSITATFQDSLTNALAGGMMGNMDSTQGFMDSIKQGLASTISSQISGALMQNSGLMDVVNGLITSITGAATGGSAEDIANMFNDGDYADKITDAMAPFLPLIEQIVASTQGMFAIMKNQVFNAPNGFKVDSYLYGMAKGKDFEGVKNWDGSDKNQAGSPTSGVGANTPIEVSDPASPPSGVPTTPSTGGATNPGNPTTTAPGGTGAPNPTQGTTPPPANTTPVNTPAKPKPAPAPSTSHNHGTLKQGATGSAVKEIQKAVGTTQDGIWGPKTTSAVKSFQKKYGLSADGIVGPKTWAKIHSLNGVSGGKSSGSSSGSSKGTSKHISSAVNFRSSAGYGSNVIGTIPKGASVQYYGQVNGWAKVGYKGKTGYVGPQFVYHSGGIAGMMNFASNKALKANEISAIMQKGEIALQPKQLAHLLGGALPKGDSASGVNFTFNVSVVVDGGGYDQKGIESAVQTAVSKAVQEVKRDQRFTNLNWRGTSY